MRRTRKPKNEPKQEKGNLVWGTKDETTEDMKATTVLVTPLPPVCLGFPARKPPPQAVYFGPSPSVFNLENNRQNQAGKRQFDSFFWLKHWGVTTTTPQ